MKHNVFYKVIMQMMFIAFVFLLTVPVMAQQNPQGARPVRLISGTLQQVDPVPPAIITIRVNNRDQTYSITDDAVITRQTTGLITPGVTPTFGAPTPLPLRKLIPGEEITIGFNALDQVMQISARASLVKARVRSVQGNQITLDDQWGTNLAIGPQIRYIDAQNQTTTAINLQAGAPVALFIAPTTRTIYQVSAHFSDLNLATAPPTTVPSTTVPSPTAPGTTTPNNTTPGSTIPGSTSPRSTPGGPLPGNMLPGAVAPSLPTTPVPPPVTPPVNLPVNPPVTLPVSPTPSRPVPVNPAPSFNPPPLAPTQWPSGVPQIHLVKHNAPRPLQNGKTVRITVRGTSRVRGTFDLSPRLQGLPLTEYSTQPGVYLGEYTVQPGDDVLNTRIVARLVGANGQEDIEQSQDILTIDTTPPRILSILPADRSIINVTQPNIMVMVDDTGGSGVAQATMTITNNGQTFNVPVTAAPPGLVTAVAPRPLTGEATIRLNVFDGAKNTTSTAFSITVARANGPITSLTHSAARALLAGEDVQVDMLAPAGGRATFDVIDETNRALAQAIPMREFGAGRYRGSYRVQANPDNLKLRLVGHYTDANNQVSHVEATTPVLALGVTPPTLAIMEPVDSARINSPVVVRGRAAPNSIVDVSLRVEGVRLQVLPYQQDLPMQQVLSDGTGSWTAQFDLPRSRNLTNWQYIITAAQADPTNRRSLPVAVVIKSPVVVARVVSKPVVIAKKVFPVRGWLASRGGNRYSKPAGVKKGAVSKKAVRPKANSKKPGVNKPALKKTAAIKARPTY